MSAHDIEVKKKEGGRRKEWGEGGESDGGNKIKQYAEKKERRQ